MSRRSSPTAFSSSPTLTLVLGLQAGYLLASWSHLTAAQAGGQSPPPLALGIWCAGLLAGLLGLRVPRLGTTLALAGGPMVAFLAGDLLLGVTGHGAAGLGLRICLAILALGPGAFTAARVLVRSEGRSAVALGTGMALAFLTASIFAGPWVVGLTYLILPLIAAGLYLRQAGSAPAGSTPEHVEKSNPWDTLGASVGAGLVMLALIAWSQIILLFCGGWSSVRLLLPAVAVAGLSLGLVMGRRWVSSTQVWLPVSGLALINLLAAGLVTQLADLTLGLAAGGTGQLGAAAVLATLTLLPIGVLSGMAWGAGGVPALDRPAASVAGALVGLLAATWLLGPALGSAGLLVFAAAALPMGLALPAIFRSGDSVRSWQRIALAALLMAASLTGFFLRPASPLLMAAGIGWQPQAFLYRPGLPPSAPARSALMAILGEQRLLAETTPSTGLTVLRESAREAASLSWMGWDLQDDRGRDSLMVTAALPLLLAGGESQAAVFGDRGGSLSAALSSLDPEIDVARYELLPGLPESRPPAGRDIAVAGVSSWVVGGPYDVIVVQPLLPAVAGTGLAWSRPALRRMAGALREDGVAVLRLPVVGNSALTFRRIITTFIAEFPAASLWFDGQGLILLGSREPLQLDLAGVERRFRQMGPALQTVGVLQVTDLLGRHVMGADSLLRLVGDLSPETRYWPRLVEGGADAAIGTGWSEILPAPATEMMPMESLLSALTQAQQDSFTASLERSGTATRWWLEMLVLGEQDLTAAMSSGQAALALQSDNNALKKAVARVSHAAGEQALDAGLMSDARVLAELAVDLDPDRIDHHLLLYDVTLRTRPAAAAQRRLQNMGRRFPDAYPLLLVMARQRLDQGEVNAAEAFLRRASDTGFDSAALHLGWARAAFAQGQAAAGRRQVQRALDMAPDAALVLADIGASLMTTQPIDAEEYLQQAYQQGQTGAVVTGLLGRLALQSGNYSQAIDLLTTAVADAPGNARLHLDLGSALLGVGQTAEAVSHLLQARDLDPANPMVRLNLAAALVREGRLQEARTELAQIDSSLHDNPVYTRLRRDLLGVQEGDL